MEKVKNVLIVEDDQLMSQILQFILKKEGYEYTLAVDGQDALDKLNNIKPDIILADIMLPFKSGLEVIRFAKQQDKNIPVIVLSSLGVEEGTVVEAFKLGVEDFVSKPFNPSELLLRIKRLLH